MSTYIQSALIGLYAAGRHLLDSACTAMECMLLLANLTPPSLCFRFAPLLQTPPPTRTSPSKRLDPLDLACLLPLGRIEGYASALFLDTMFRRAG